MNFGKIPPLFKPIANVPEELAAGEIVILLGDLASGEEIPLSREERHRAEGMSSMKARLPFLAARRMLRSVLSQWYGVPCGELTIMPDAFGKPRLVTDDPIHFSITHSSECVAAAFSRSEVGLDVERMREVDARMLASRFFSRKEAADVAASGNPELFFKLWTCREAAIKADGRGMSKLIGITEVVSGSGGEEETVEVLIGSDRWRSVHWKIDAETHAALAYREHPPLISWCDLRCRLE
jgi:4'-phosphopantetheinyl transferase